MSAPGFVLSRVRSSDSIGALASEAKISAYELMRANGVSPPPGLPVRPPCSWGRAVSAAVIAGGGGDGARNGADPCRPGRKFVQFADGQPFFLPPGIRPPVVSAPVPRATVAAGGGLLLLVAVVAAVALS